MSTIADTLKKADVGAVMTDAETREDYSHDASIFELTPEVVIQPRSAHDIERLVATVSELRQNHPSIGITPRAAGTDMSGAAIGSSIVVDMTKHFGTIHDVNTRTLKVQPGAYMHDIDPLLDKKGLMLGCVPASRALCTIGGMVANNSGGEQSLRFGNTENFVAEVKAVLADGNEYTFKPLNKRELDAKMAQDDFEGDVYRRTFELIRDNYDLVRNARPLVNKNSMGYNLWSAWDPDDEIFDMTRILTGSQGTLGIMTDLKMFVLPKAKHSGLLVLYLPNIKQLGELIPLVMSHKPATFEGFDDITFNLGIKHFSLFKKALGLKEWTKQQASLLASVAAFKGRTPNMVLMVEFEGDSLEEVHRKIDALAAQLKGFTMKKEVAGDEEASSKFWQIRRASLSLLRHQVHDKYASAFMDDLTVQPKYLPEFLPELRKIIKRYKLPATIAGHFGDGNFHVIPLMSISDPAEQAKLEPVMRDLVALVLKYNGTLAGEHNDGMVRGPWLPAVFGNEMYDLFRAVKEIFDPLHIFNPHKKTDASWDYSMDHIRTSRRRNFYKE